jgi:hypothetical protein
MLDTYAKHVSTIPPSAGESPRVVHGPKLHNFTRSDRKSIWLDPEVSLRKCYSYMTESRFLSKLSIMKLDVFTVGSDCRIIISCNA